MIETRERTYLVIDLAALDPPTGETFRVELSLRPEATESEFTNGTETAGTNVTVTNNEVTVSTDTLRPTENETVRGTTTLAPGTELNLRLVSRATRPRSVKPVTVTVSPNRTFRASFDLAAQAGSVPSENTRVRAFASVETLVETSRDLTLRPAVTPTPTQTNTTATDAPTPTAAALTPELQGNVTGTIATEAETPGFTVLLAVLGTALLASRR